MHVMTRYTAWFYLVLLNLITASSSFAEDQAVPQPPPWPGWHAMQWHGFWWIFPLLFFVMMIVMCFLMMRRGGMGCMWHDRKMNSPESRDVMGRSMGDSSESALNILDKRYASGEIDKQEYEEKKAAIISR
jgi:uncharacterized membrane protein